MVDSKFIRYRWVANVLATVPIVQLQNKHFKIQGNVASANEVVKLWEKKHNVRTSP